MKHNSHTSTATKRKQRDRLIRQRDILSSAEKLFASNGFHKTTIDEIAEKAGYGVGTIYLYFKNKQNLYFSLIYQKFAELITKIESEANKYEDVFDKVRAIIETQFSFFDRNKYFFRIFIKENVGMKGLGSEVAIYRDIMDLLSKYLDFVSSVLHRGIVEKRIVKHNPRRLAFFLAGMIRSNIFFMIMKSQSESIKKSTEFVYNLFMDGLSRKRK